MKSPVLVSRCLLAGHSIAVGGDNLTAQIHPTTYLNLFWKIDTLCYLEYITDISYIAKYIARSSAADRMIENQDSYGGDSTRVVAVIKFHSRNEISGW